MSSLPHPSLERERKWNHTFYLGGRRHECSLVELAWRLDHSTSLRQCVKGFRFFLIIAINIYLEELMNLSGTLQLQIEVIHLSLASEGRIHCPIQMYTNRLITFSINQKKEGYCIPMLDIFFLWCIIIPHTFCHLPYCVVDFLTDKAGKIGWSTCL